jgi:hypothetical protein
MDFTEQPLVVVSNVADLIKATLLETERNAALSNSSARVLCAGVFKERELINAFNLLHHQVCFFPCRCLGVCLHEHYFPQLEPSSPGCSEFKLQSRC